MIRGTVLSLLILSLGAVQENAPRDGHLVVGPRRVPVADAQIEAISRPRTDSVLAAATSPSWKAVTDAHGRMKLRLPAGRPLLVAIDHPELAPFLESLRAPLPPVLELDAGATLRGRIVEPTRKDWQGKACAHWESVAEEWHRRFSWRRCGQLSREGELRIRGVPSEPVDVVVAADGFLAARVEMRPGKTAELALERGVLVRGAVEDPRGRPVAGASVRAKGEPPIQSERDGRFVLPVRELPATVRIDHESFSPEVRRITRPGERERPIEVTLQPAQRLTGQVLSAVDSDLDSVRIILRRHGGDGARVQRSRHTATLEDGRFELSVERPGLYGVSLRAEGHRDVAIPRFRLRRGGHRDLGTIELAAGAIVRGRVLDSRSGEGVAAAQAGLVPQGEQVFRHLAEGRHFDGVSEADGELEIRGVEAGDFELLVESPDHAPLRREVSLDQDEVVDLGSLYLKPGTALHGRVVDRRGTPMGGATVQIFDAGRAALLPVAESVTTADGTFSDLTLMAGKYRVEVSRERLLLSQALEVPTLDEYEVELVAGGVELRGRVTRRGEPVAGGLLVLDSEHDPGVNGAGKVVVRRGGGLTGDSTVYGAPEASASGDVRDDGTFFIPNAPTGEVLATYYDPGGPPVRRRIRVPDRATARIDLDLGGVTLEGRVLDGGTGAGVAGSVQLLTGSGAPVGSTSANAEGRFRLADLAPGVYTARIAAEGYRTRILDSIEISHGRQPLQVRLEPADSGSLQVSLRRAEGSPLAGVFVSLVDQGGTTVRSLLSDAQGDRRYDDLAPGRYHVVWSDPGIGVGVSRTLNVRAGETTRLRKVLPRGGAVTLVCGSAVCGGRPLDHLLLFSGETGVEISRFMAGMAANARFTRQGRLSLGSLSPGSYVIHVGVGGVDVERRFEMAPGSDRVLRLERDTAEGSGSSGA